MPPRVLLHRGKDELRLRLDEVIEPRRRFATGEVINALGAPDLDALWQRLAAGPYPFVPSPGEVSQAAEDAVARRVDLLGSGPVELGSPVDWHRDPRTGRRWPLAYGRTIDYVNLGEPSDVKLPWEISRLQWLLPAGLAYLLTREERYATAVRDTLADWIEGNPYPYGINWAIAMEPALRILTWIWLFHACHDSEAFVDPVFRASFLRMLYLHGRFVARNIERSDVNGNHHTADATGLVFAGLFLGEPRWAEEGWRILVEELPRQVYEDGVDFEAAFSYHRLVSELFELPALYRRARGLDVPSWYEERLEAMERFTAAVTRADGSIPVVGDNDDARALPIGKRPEPAEATDSAAFPDGGFYILRGAASHVVVDCGPVGLAGRGGHGHNDCLSFEAWLDGRPVIVDSGCFVYTASPEWRNRLRATAAHNTPQVDGVEQGHLDPQLLWTLGAEAVPLRREWLPSATVDRLVVSHGGYRRLPNPVIPVRTFALDRASGTLAVGDGFEGSGDHEVRVPYHLAPGIEAVEERPGRWVLGGTSLVLELEPARDWEASLRESWFAPHYGVRVESRCLELRRSGPLRPLLVAIGPGQPLDRMRPLT
jgi:uncharacterized heparinase superfamily protein